MAEITGKVRPTLSKELSLLQLYQIWSQLGSAAADSALERRILKYLMSVNAHTIFGDGNYLGRVSREPIPYTSRMPRILDVEPEPTVQLIAST